MIETSVPGRGTYRIEHVVLDVNGTIAIGGELIPGVAERLARLRKHVEVHLLTADTRGKQNAIDNQLGTTAARTGPDDGAAQKAAYVRRLGKDRVCAIGNGAIDAQMLAEAVLAIAVLETEGLAVEALTSADIIAPNACAALDLLLDPLRIVAGLRR